MGIAFEVPVLVPSRGPLRPRPECCLLCPCSNSLAIAVLRLHAPRFHLQYRASVAKLVGLLE